MWKDFFYFTQRERQGILVLTVLVAGIFIGRYLFTRSDQKVIEPLLPDTGQNEPLPTEKKRSGDHEARTYYQPYKKEPVRPQPDLPEKRTYYSQSADTHSRVPPLRIEKYSPGTKVNFNSADTADLIRIPGVGQAYATRIIKYRRLLGGYYSVEQLKEVYGMYEELYEKIIPYFEVSIDSVLRIPVNKSSLERLKAHPYLNFYQARAIVELRKKKGPLKDISELSLLEEFPASDLERIKYYLLFD